MGYVHEYVGVYCMSYLILAIPFCENLSADPQINPCIATLTVEVSVSEVSRGGFMGWVSGVCNPPPPSPLPQMVRIMVYITALLMCLAMHMH